MDRISALASVVGVTGVKALSSKFAGQRVYVPYVQSEAMERFMENFSPLIGADKVMALVDNFGGLRITVPTGYVRPKVNVQEVADLTIQLLTTAQIAKVLRCDPRTVYYARAKAMRLGLLKRPAKRKRKRK